MTDLLFSCPHCSKHLVIDGVASGKKLKCVECGQSIEVPVSAWEFKCPSCSCNLSVAADDQSERYHCPACEKALPVTTAHTVRLPPKRSGGWTTSPDAAD